MCLNYYVCVKRLYAQTSFEVYSHRCSYYFIYFMLPSTVSSVDLSAHVLLVYPHLRKDLYLATTVDCVVV